MLYKKILLIILGIFISLLFLECSLQLISITNNFVNDIHKEKKIKKSGNFFSIMCIGESTTYHQYPKYLKEYLDKYETKIKFNVIDCGHSAYRLYDLYYVYKKEIEKYNPDIVVGMIGINDMIETNFNSYSKIKTIYLFNLIKEHIKHLVYFKRIEKKFNKQQYSVIPNQSVANGTKKKLSKILFSDQRDIELNKVFGNKEKDMLLGIYSIKEEFFSTFLSEYYKDTKTNTKFEDILQNIISNNDIKDEFKFGFLGIYNLLNNNFDLGEQFLNKADSIRLTYNYTEISKKYKKILDLIISKNIKYIAMQYPVRDISSLEKIIEKTKYKNKVIFIDNKKSFREALKKEEKYNIFEDLFAWDFGHCKEYGNRLIAENLAKEIIKTIKSN